MRCLIVCAVPPLQKRLVGGPSVTRDGSSNAHAHILWGALVGGNVLKTQM